MTRVQRSPEVGHRRPGGRRHWAAIGGLLAVFAGSAAATGYLLPHPGATVERTATPARAVPGAHLVAGVPVGYPHTEAGAQSAAANYLTAYASDRMFTPAERHRIIAAITDPAQTAALTRTADRNFTGAAGRLGLNPQGLPLEAGTTFVSRAVPVGVRTLGYSPALAVVSVWGTGIVGLSGPSSTRPVMEAWSTTTVTLRWAAGDWRWSSFARADGPVPAPGPATPTDQTGIASAIDSYGGLSYARAH